MFIPALFVIRTNSIHVFIAPCIHFPFFLPPVDLFASQLLSFSLRFFIHCHSDSLRFVFHLVAAALGKSKERKISGSRGNRGFTTCISPPFFLAFDIRKQCVSYFCCVCVCVFLLPSLLHGTESYLHTQYAFGLHHHIQQQKKTASMRQKRRELYI